MTVSLVLVFFIHCEFFCIHNVCSFNRPVQYTPSNQNSLIYNAEEKTETDRTQQKQGKRLILIDKSIARIF